MSSEVTPSEDNKEIVRRFYKEILEEGCLDVADDLFDPNWILHEDNEVGFWTLEESKSSGPAAVKELVRRIRDFVSNLQVSEDQIAAEGDRVVTRFAVSGTAEDTQVDVKGISISQLSGGKIVGSWLNWESEFMFRQLGFIGGPRRRPLW
jgi:hypothetical protein